MFFRSLIFAFLLSATAVAPALAATYDLDPAHTRIGFAVKHMVISMVRGEFHKFAGTFEMDNGALKSAQATVDVASINTREEKRDNHLRSEEFFDAENHPKMTFVSTKVTRDGDKYTVEGDLTIRDVTKPVVLTGEMLGEAKDPWGNMRAGFHAEGKINRQDFGISFNKLLEAGGLVVANDVTIVLDIEGVKRKEG